MQGIRLILTFLVLLSAFKTTADDECFRLASPEAVPFVKLDSNAAILSCEKAYNVAPNDPLIGAYFARALLKEKFYDKALELNLKAANAGIAFAQSNLGATYQNGYGVQKDDVKALKWYLAAAGQGFPMGMYGVGNIYYYGSGVSQSDSEALRWYLKAANKGLSQAQFSVGYMLQLGKGTAPDLPKAFSWFSKAARSGNVSAKYAIGLSYLRGYGVEKNKDLAIKWLKNSALQGHKKAKILLETLVAEKKATSESIEKDFSHKYAQFIPKRLHSKVLQAEKGDGKMAGMLGNAYNYGSYQDIGKVTKNIEVSIYFYELGAELGDLGSQQLVGLIYYRGKQVKKDLKKASHYYRMAALQDSRVAYVSLAKALIELGGTDSYKEAYTWLRKDIKETPRWAKSTLKENYSLLGYLYEHGYGVKQSYGDAYSYHMKAYDKEIESALALAKYAMKGQPYVKRISYIAANAAWLTVEELSLGDPKYDKIIAVACALSIEENDCYKLDPLFSEYVKNVVHAGECFKVKENCDKTIPEAIEFHKKRSKEINKSVKDG
ncbi:tetratricopeptide repeat protein [Glaciecola petra]|uniref:SEL1-like repeat protein n=1 Tax=Glaciecola petra TaxID=3075602 RepID=A0ABU2ZUV9_9ALTE|nr:SEL1-like repeat protein [Aestuariibacter sp. P117]MDT0596109.1 SEL1-like repeat protein [Aestuariibacter sp. P117]